MPAIGHPSADTAPKPSLFKRRLVLGLVLGVITLVFLGLFTFAIQVVLLTFAGVLGGVLLSGLTSMVGRRLPVPRWAALTLVIVLLVVLAVGAGALVGPALYEQSVELSTELPAQMTVLIADLESSRVMSQLLAQLPEPSELFGANLASGVASAFTNLAGALFAGFFILVTSVFFAASPDGYTQPLVRLVPPVHRQAVTHLLDLIGQNLRSWLVARFVAMLAVGVLTGVGLWILGIPAAAALGLLAGLMSFIPNLGPILSALPGVVLGFAISPLTAVWTILIYIGVQTIENNLITPFAEQRAVSIPPAYLLAVQLLMGLLTGLLGLVVATPVLVVVVLTVRELYVKRIEGGAVEPPEAGESSGDAGDVQASAPTELDDGVAVASEPPTASTRPPEETS